MPLFVCDECEHVENTALGRYWSRDSAEIWDKENLGKALCSVCAPKFYRGGERTEYGIWHGRFLRRHATETEVKDGVFINRPKKEPNPFTKN